MTIAGHNRRPWFQVQASILDSIDLNRLAPEHERIWWRLHALCCNRGSGDTIAGRPADIAWHLRTPEPQYREAIAALSQPGSDGEPLVESTETSIRIIKWLQYQPPTTDAERKAIQRDRKRRESHGTVTGQSRDVSVTSHVLEVEGEVEEEVKNPPLATLATPPSAPAAPKPPRKKPSRALPDEWGISPAHRAKAEGLGVDVQAEAERFRDYHRAKGSLFADWDAAFRTWLGNSVRFSSGRAAPQRTTKANRVLEAAKAAVLAVEAAQEDRR